jgi:hypothetical protein
MIAENWIHIILGVVSFGALLLAKNNKKKSEENQKKMQDRRNYEKRFDLFKNSSDFQHSISPFILKLLEKYEEHEKVEKRISVQEIKNIEGELQLTLPESYKIFLKHFGDGGDWVFNQNIDSVRNFSWFTDYRENLYTKIELVGEKKVDVNTLLCLMTEDSNGGAWCWLTSEVSGNGEWPLAYYSLSDEKLHYKVENFTEWLKILTDEGNEVIRELDVDEKLDLG